MRILVVSFLSLFCPLALFGEDSTITGILNVQGTDMNLGISNGASTPVVPGFTLKYTDSAAGTSTSLWWARKTSHEWIFSHAGAGYDRLVMKLDADHKLLLYTNSSGNTAPSITLDPNGVSSFAGGVAITGSVNIAGSPAVTTSTGDARYIKLGINNVGGAHSFVGGTNAIATDNSVAIGVNAKAQAYDSIALGTGVVGPTAYHSVAIGSGAIVSGTAQVATAIGTSTASGNFALAAGYSQASEQFSTALGMGIASGSYSSALGQQTRAEGNSSFAAGDQGKAVGIASAALNQYTLATGRASTALGFQTTADSLAQLVIGRWNVIRTPANNPTAWVLDDELFVIGNGKDGGIRSNAMVVKKSGDTEINGALKVTGVILTSGPAGDIPMFQP